MKPAAATVNPALIVPAHFRVPRKKFCVQIPPACAIINKREQVTFVLTGPGSNPTILIWGELVRNFRQLLKTNLLV